MAENTNSKGKVANAADFYSEKPISGFKAEDLLAMARLRLLRDFPFFGKIAQSMPFIEDNRFPTTAVDPKGRLFFNRKWVNGMTLEDAVFEFGHETMHLVQRCFARKPQAADPGLWNKAADWLCDTSLVDAGLEQSKVSREAVGPTEQAKTRELGTIEMVYKYMLQEQEEQQRQCKACQQEGKQTKQASQQAEKEQVAENKAINGNSASDDSDGEDSGESNAPGGDGHEHGEGDGCGGNEPLEHTCGNIRQCCVGSTADFSESTPLEEQTALETIVAAKMHAESKGNMPAGLGEQISELTKSTVRWQDYIKSRATAVFGRDRYTFKRPNRRGHAIGMRLAGQQPDGKSAVIAIDTSGSMSDEAVRQCVTESAAILKACGAKKTFLILHDMVVYYAGEVTEKDLTSLRMARGGTSHREVFALLNGETVNNVHGEFKMDWDDDLELAILFTDLGTDFPDTAPTGYEVIWGVNVDGYPGMNREVPFGLKVPVEITKDA